MGLKQVQLTIKKNAPPNENMDLSIAWYFYLKIPRFFLVTDFYSKGDLYLFFQDKRFKGNS
jgi:hypothetical protein